MDFTLKAIAHHFAGWVVAGVGLGIGYGVGVWIKDVICKLIPKKGAPAPVAQSTEATK